MLLEVKNLKTYFHTEEGLTKAVDDISFQLQAGEVLGIVGESGSGKSVTSLSMMQLLPTAGKIVGGEILYTPEEHEKVNLVECTEDEMRQYRGNEIAMIFQEPMTSLNPVFTCGQQVVEAIIQHQNIDQNTAKKLSLDWFEKVQLPDAERIFSAYPHQLSGGQKQRVMIAMAMSCQPRVLIADEPTTALDVTIQKNILELMKQLKKDFQTSMIFITHDLGVIAEIADRVLVMFKGKIVEQGTIKEIFQQPKHPYTKSLLACRPTLDKKLKKMPVIEDFMTMTLTADGTYDIQEKPAEVKEVLHSVMISKQEINDRLSQLQKQKAILEVKHLKTWYPHTTNFFGQVTDYVKAVDDVSFEVFPGETMGLVGESGCGKTTLGRTILRLTPALSGEVIYQGKNMLTLSEKELRQIRKDVQIIFQDPYSSLNPRMTIGQSLLEPMQVHGILNNDQQRKEKVLDLLETVQMSSKYYHRYPHEFSGGQRQRICIARALALEPKFIICDECVSALDVSVQAQVLNLLMDLQERFQLTYIFISHDLSVVKQMSDRMIVMNKGKIEEMGPAEAIYTQAQKKYTQELIQAIPKIIY